MQQALVLQPEVVGYVEKVVAQKHHQHHSMVINPQASLNASYKTGFSFILKIK